MKGGVEIKSDLYNITARLREIDKGYFVVRKKGRFEIHNRFQQGSTFCIALPYPVLDCRALTLVQKTRIEKSKEFYARMEQENQRLQSNLMDRAVKNAEYKLENILKTEKKNDG